MLAHTCRGSRQPPAPLALLKAGDAAAVVITGVNAEIDYWTALVPALRAEGITLPILACDSDGPCPGADGLFEDMLAEDGGADIEPEGDENALAAYYHTGGTTGASEENRSATPRPSRLATR